MKPYISILRGINVSGQKLVKMNLLQEMFDNLGFKNPITYLQSGNVIFQGENYDTNVLEEKISQQIIKDFGFEVPVIVMSMDRLEETINNLSFPLM